MNQRSCSDLCKDHAHCRASRPQFHATLIHRRGAWVPIRPYLQRANSSNCSYSSAPQHSVRTESWDEPTEERSALSARFCCSPDSEGTEACKDSSFMKTPGSELGYLQKSRRKKHWLLASELVVNRSLMIIATLVLRRVALLRLLASSQITL